MSWTWIDWAFAILLGFSILTGLARGFIREGLGLAAWIVALLAARALAEPAGDLFEHYIGSAQIRLVAGFALVVIAVLIAARLVIRVVHAMIEWAGMGFFNRLLGALFGALRGALVLILLVAVVGLTPLRQSPAWQQSQLIPRVEQGRDLLIARYQQLDRDGELLDEANRRAEDLQQSLPSRLGEQAVDQFQRTPQNGGQGGRTPGAEPDSAR
ncbi:CvpA family protein [Kushneria aurantia]|uniref:CvpA family protein n=1 Tax=Kushneria aurantia TaxID=504092 RepID=A0ABV6G735_9GAMM|nr:CvpA family protein [Kushneria aurantia]